MTTTATPIRRPYAAGPVGLAPVVSVAPVVLPAPGRVVDLQVRVSAPETGCDLPVVVLSHGHGPSRHLSSFDGYHPLADFWAARGFVVVQPTHLDAMRLDLRGSDDPEAPLFWRSRAVDVSLVLDHLDAVEAAVPGLAGRVDRTRVAVAGHSMGGHTASLLLGARLVDPHDGTVVDLADPRITAGVLLAAPGRGGDALSAVAAEHYPVFATTDFGTMRTPALVVVGDADASPHLTVRGPAWHADPYLLAPGPAALLTLFGGEHGLGGVSGYDVAETTDEDPARLAAVQWLTWAYLRTQLGVDADAWPAAVRALTTAADPVGRVETRS